MNLPPDKARCSGDNCPSKRKCLRYTDKPARNDDKTNYAAFWARREAGSSACESIIGTGHSTFNGRFKGAKE